MTTLIDGAIAILLGAILVEAVVNAVEVVRERQLDWQWVLALAVSLLVAVAYSLDLFALVGLETELPYVGSVLTGVIISRGSNYLADIVAALTELRRPSAGVTVYATPAAGEKVETELKIGS